MQKPNCVAAFPGLKGGPCPICEAGDLRDRFQSRGGGASLRSREETATVALTEHLGDLSKRPEEQCHFPEKVNGREGRGHWGAKPLQKPIPSRSPGAEVPGCGGPSNCAQ